MKRASFWSWLWFVLGVLYFAVPLVSTLLFSLRAERGTYSLTAYRNVLADPQFLRTFIFSVEIAVLTILFSLLLIVPTVYWVHLKLPQIRPFMEFVAFLPFVLPAVVLVFGLIRIYSRPPLALTNTTLTTNLLLIAAYMGLALPYMYRAVDTGMRAIDIRTLTEAAQSLGAGWPTIIRRVIFPNLRTALLSGTFLTFAIVIGEFVLASLLNRPAFGVYMQNIGANRAYEPSALAIISFALTWGAMGVIQLLDRFAPKQARKD